MKYLFILAVLFAVLCSEDIVTVTVIARANGTHTYFDDFRIYSDGALVDVILQGDTSNIDVENGARMVAKYVKTVMEPSIRVTNEEDTETARDGMVWKIDEY